MSMPAKKPMRAEFRDFVARGNILDLAVAIVIGIAFGAVVLALIDFIIMPLIAAIFGQPNFDELTATVGDGVIRYGSFLTALVNFLIIAFAMFLIVVGVARMQARRRVIDLTEPEAPVPTDEARLLTEIRDLLARTRTR